MKVIGRIKQAPTSRGFTPELNGFLKLCARFRKSGRYVPPGVYRFSSFDEANEWNMKMLLGRTPGQDPRR